MRCGRDEDAAVAGGACFETTKSAAQERARSDGIAGVQMVEGGRHLNEGLQEALLRLLQVEPCALPVFVRLEELFVPVAGEAFG